MTQMRHGPTSLIAHAVADAECDRLHGNLQLLLRTLKRATLRERLRYLFTRRIPRAEYMKVGDGVRNMTIDTFDDWIK